jgi:hypothetical protein
MSASTLKTNPNFRWLLRGAIVSNLGDQLTLVAVPLLVLYLTGDPLALGVVIALMGIPRAVFILFGGAIVDRFSPQRVLFASKMANAVLLGLLTLLVLNTRPAITLAFGSTFDVTVHLTPRIELLLIDALAFCLGLAQAFGIPAGSAIVPAAVPDAILAPANGVLMGLRQVSMLAGPLLAATLVRHGTHGLALAFALDAASFVASAWMLQKVTLASESNTAAAHSVLHALGAGLAQAWRDVALRLCFIYWAIMAVLIGGALQVALPVLASASFQGGTLGWWMGAQGGGTLLGMAIAALATKRLQRLRFGATILLVDVGAGLLVAPLGYLGEFGHEWLVAVLLLGGGILSGFLQLSIYTWIARRVPVAMLGRAMSMFMFIFMGLAPLSAAGAGWLLTRIDVAHLFLAGGTVLVMLAGVAWVATPMRHIPQN